MTQGRIHPGRKPQVSSGLPTAVASKSTIFLDLQQWEGIFRLGAAEIERHGGRNPLVQCRSHSRRIPSPATAPIRTMLPGSIPGREATDPSTPSPHTIQPIRLSPMSCSCIPMLYRKWKQRPRHHRADRRDRRPRDQGCPSTGALRPRRGLAPAPATAAATGATPIRTAAPRVACGRGPSARARPSRPARLRRAGRRSSRGRRPTRRRGRPGPAGGPAAPRGSVGGEPGGAPAGRDRAIPAATQGPGRRRGRSGTAWSTRRRPPRRGEPAERGRGPDSTTTGPEDRDPPTRLPPQRPGPGAGRRPARGTAWLRTARGRRARRTGRRATAPPAAERAPGDDRALLAQREQPVAEAEAIAHGVVARPPPIGRGRGGCGGASHSTTATSRAGPRRRTRNTARPPPASTPGSSGARSGSATPGNRLCGASTNRGAGGAAARSATPGAARAVAAGSPTTLAKHTLWIER